VGDDELLALERAACPTCCSCSGMFTATPMNYPTEAPGLALPGRGTLVATHADRRELFLQAARTVVDLSRRHHQGGETSVLPRAIASHSAFENAIRLDVAMGGSTNTVLHLLDTAHEGAVDFKLADIDCISRSTQHLSKLSPSSPLWFVHDLHRAGVSPACWANWRGWPCSI
jgi:dihydroxy-acid dehydratase